MISFIYSSMPQNSALISWINVKVAYRATLYLKRNPSGFRGSNKKYEKAGHHAPNDPVAKILLVHSQIRLLRNLKIHVNIMRN